jgi:BirA family biotin operon repressor/biotin-[acetyl-CoA-carboxylase] ligase
VTAEQQRAGRGRQGRAWESPPGASLLFALLLRPAGEGARILPLISLAAATALAQAGRALGAALAVKWPNDVLSAAGGKLAGILPEARIEGGRCRHLLLGVGINVHQGFGEGAPPLFPRSESLDRAAGRRLSRGALLADFLAALAPRLAALEAGESAALLAAWREFWPHRGRLARDEGGTVWRLEDIEADGRLRVLGPDGPGRLAAGSLTLLPAAPAPPGRPPAAK